jgi:hypothetical protein
MGGRLPSQCMPAPVGSLNLAALPRGYDRTTRRRHRGLSGPEGQYVNTMLREGAGHRSKINAKT